MGGSSGFPGNEAPTLRMCTRNRKREHGAANSRSVHAARGRKVREHPAKYTLHNNNGSST